MVKIKLPLYQHNHSANASIAHQNQQQQNLNLSSNHSFTENSYLQNSLNESQNFNTPSQTDNAKLWDNDELVMKALRVYGKMPRPQVFNEISRVCKLSNLRKSRYFHEKMMKNNPFKEKILKLIQEEGEQTYPYFKIFFEEYRTKKQRLSLINNNENISEQTQVLNMKKENDKSLFTHYQITNGKTNGNNNNVNTNKLDNSVENSVENSNDYENSNSDQIYYNNDEINNENYEYNEDYIEEDDNMNGGYNGNNTNNNGELCQEVYVQNTTDYDADATAEINYTNVNEEEYYAQNDHITPLIDTNTNYLENLELKLKILNKEKENMTEYFETFTTVIGNLKNEIDRAKNDEENKSNETKLDKITCLDKSKLKNSNLDNLNENLIELTNYIDKINNDNLKFSKDQAILREDLKVTKNYAKVENIKLQDELNTCKAQLVFKNEEVNDLKKRLEESMRQNRASSAKHLVVQSSATLMRNKMNELKENMDRMSAQIYNLS